MTEEQPQMNPQYQTMSQTVPSVTWKIEHSIFLRDWFAGLVMQGVLSDPAVAFPSEELARDVYKQADFMLAARKEQ